MLRINIFTLWVLTLVSWVNLLPAQQVPFATTHLFKPEMLNPAAVGQERLPSVSMIYRQQGVTLDNWSSTTQWLRFSSRPIGSSQRFGWGIALSKDSEHSEQRMEASPMIAAKLVETNNLAFSMGISAGIVHWRSNYDEIRVYDRTEDLVRVPFTFLELNAGAGANFSYKNRFLKAEANTFAWQLPGSMVTNRLNGIRIRPQYTASASVLVNAIYNLDVGPMVNYRNTLNQRDTTLRSGNLDLGLRANFDRQGFWLGGAYRMGESALSLAFGLRLAGSDSLANPDAFHAFLDLTAATTYPIQESSIFGPEIDLGLVLTFGRNKTKGGIDTTTLARTFWKNAGYLNSHKVKYMDHNAPPELEAFSTVDGRRVRIWYEFPDQSLLYSGVSPLMDDTLVAKLGFEWQGVDVLLERMVNEVIREGINPRTEGIEDPENLEPLKSFSLLELSADLKVDEVGAHMGAEGTIYEGELGTNNATEDTLFLRVVFNDADTMLTIVKNHYVTNLELAALKLHGMRLKLTYELQKKFGEDMIFIWEGEPFDWEDAEGFKVMTIKKLRITPDFANQTAFQVNRVGVRFLRFKQFLEKEDDDVFRDEETFTREGRRKKKREERSKD